MNLTLRQRISLIWLPMFALTLLVGALGASSLLHLGSLIEKIMKENYRSVIYMKDLNEALERIDSSFHLALAGREPLSKAQYDENWKRYHANLDDEKKNITLPGEQEYVDKLAVLTSSYQREGDEFFDLTRDSDSRSDAYFNSGGLRDTFQEIKGVADQIREINQANMLQVRDEARNTAWSSMWGFGSVLYLGAVIAVSLATYSLRAVLNQIRTMTESAIAIGKGDLDQIVPATSKDELGSLAQAFNTMTRQLRDHRDSQQSRIQRIQQSTQATVDAFPNPVLVLDAECHVEMANPAARKALGVMPGSGSEKSTYQWQPPNELRQPLLQALQNQQPYLPEGFDHAVFLRIANQDRVFLPRLFPIRDSYGATLGVAVLLEDVTRFRLLDEVKSNLVATVSHELKTPLTSIRLAVHLLSEETVGPLTPKQLELVLDARDNAERLLSMINNLLDLAQHERGSHELELQQVQPSTLLRDAADMVRPRAEDKAIEIVLNTAIGLPDISVDVLRMGQALQNLLDNALTYTERGGSITLSADMANDQVSLSIVDTGIGIPSEHLTHVFDWFFRVPGRSRIGGTGLGLAIVREIVTAHGGTVTCDSRVDEGTEFRISLPAKRSIESQVQQPETTSQGSN